MAIIDFKSSLHAGLFEGLAAGEEWKALSRLAAYLDALRPAVAGRVDPAAILGDHVHVERNAHLMAGSVVEGPAWIGEGAVIRPGAYLRGAAVIGAGVVVGHGTEVKNSILLEEATAAHLSYVGDSILGRGVMLGAGVKLANARLDDGFIAIVHEGRRMSTGLRRLGSIVGDGSRIGCNCVLNPGTVIAAGARVPPLTSLQGYVAGPADPAGEKGGR